MKDSIPQKALKPFCVCAKTRTRAARNVVNPFVVCLLQVSPDCTAARAQGQLVGMETALTPKKKRAWPFWQKQVTTKRFTAYSSLGSMAFLSYHDSAHLVDRVVSVCVLKLQLVVFSFSSLSLYNVGMSCLGLLSGASRVEIPFLLCVCGACVCPSLVVQQPQSTRWVKK